MDNFREKFTIRVTDHGVIITGKEGNRLEFSAGEALMLLDVFKNEESELRKRVEEVECHPRTLYRDLEALQVAGFPLFTDRVEGKKLWSVLATVKHHIPVPFSLTELMALYFSRDMLKVFKDTVFYDSLESLFKKIKTTIPPESLKYLEQVQQTLHVGIKPFKDYARFRGIIQRVSDAAVKKRSIEIVYYTMSRKKESRRRVDPYRVWFFNGTFYLIGHCHTRNEVRIFALDRIKMLRETKDTFEPSLNGFS